MPWLESTLCRKANSLCDSASGQRQQTSGILLAWLTKEDPPSHLVEMWLQNPSHCRARDIPNQMHLEAANFLCNSMSRSKAFSSWCTCGDVFMHMCMCLCVWVLCFTCVIQSLNKSTTGL